jgi:hypothetical protein
MEEKIQNAIDLANKEFRENDCAFEAEPNLNAPLTTTINIEWGDWKHEHGYADYVMSQHGFTKVKEQITEEDCSDCYSSIHTYFYKGK